MKKQKIESLLEKPERYREEIDQPDSQDIVMTAKTIRTVHTFIFSDISFNQHKNILKLQEINGADIGLKHRDRSSATRMLHFISRQIHFDFMNDLNISSKPVSILIDTSTDISNNHYLVIELYYIKNGNPIFVFYRLIKIGVEERFQNLFELIVNAFKDDGMYDYFKENMIGFISDSARVLMGAKNSVMSKFKDWIKSKGKKLFSIKCSAHKLETAVKHSYKKISSIQYVEDSLNDIANFFMELVTNQMHF